MARQQRRLGAIVAADVVGYSRLMGRDESGMLACLREHRKQRFEPTLARHGGRLVKLTGDGALVEFPSAVDALSAAIEFQQALAERRRACAAEGRALTRADLRAAIMDGAVERVRPKMMTVVAIMAGLLPLLWNEGTGSEVMRRIAVPMIGGMASSTLLTLIVIPAVYSLVHGWPLRRASSN